MKFLFLLLTLGLLFNLSSQAGDLKIVSTAPSITEIIYAIGADDMLVGVSSYCNYPPDVKNKEVVGTFSDINIEKIIVLKPDIVFTTGIEQLPIKRKLDEFGIKNITISPKNKDELFRDIIVISNVLGKNVRGEELVNSIKNSLGEIQRKIPKGRKPKVMLELFNKPLMVAGTTSFVGEMIELAGGENIAYDTPRAYSIFSSEVVVERNPDCIILAHGSKGAIEEVRKRAGWSNISAVKNGKIYDDIPPDLILRPSPRFAEGVSLIYERLYEK